MIGELTVMATDREPEGFLHCDGREVKVKDYPMLYAVIGSRFGGNGQESFRLPKIVADINGPIPNTYWFIHASEDNFPEFDD